MTNYILIKRMNYLLSKPDFSKKDKEEIEDIKEKIEARKHYYTLGGNKEFTDI